MGNNCHKSPELLIENGEEYSISYWLPNAFEGQVPAYAPERLLSASFWERGFTQTGVT
jgi:hypothetical protein